MPVTPTYPGVYVEEIPSEVRTIVGVATSITAFVGRTLRGPVDKPVTIQSFADFQRTFGQLWAESTLSYAVQHYFQHGGRDAIIVRVARNANTAAINLPAGGDHLVLAAVGPGLWGNALRASVNYEATKDPANLFTVTIQELENSGSQKIVQTETFLNLSGDSNHSRYVTTVINEQSRLVNVQGTAPTARPDPTITNADDPTDPAKYVAANGNGSDGEAITDGEITNTNLKPDRRGIYALENADLFNMLCIPPLERDDDGDTDMARAAKFCKDHRAVLILDPPAGWTDTDSAKSGVDNLRTTVGDARDHAAAYFPRLRMPDSLQENRLAIFAPCGAVAGIISRTDSARGVWKAPAGIEASLAGVRDLAYKLTNGQNGQLNPLGLNCIRNFPVYGNVLWGARTLAGADALASEWKYLPVRRLALFIEESLDRGTQWVVFEANDEPLWAQIRLNVGAFMNNLFRQGAFQGKSPREAYFVKCDRETTTQNDVDRGIVNIWVGFAPLKPAEFVIIKIQQIAGQIET
jgi:hypothetical protein